MCVCVCVCLRDRERLEIRDSGLDTGSTKRITVWQSGTEQAVEREQLRQSEIERVCVCVSVSERERVCVCV